MCIVGFVNCPSSLLHFQNSRLWASINCLRLKLAACELMFVLGGSYVGFKRVLLNYESSRLEVGRSLAVSHSFLIII